MDKSEHIIHYRSEILKKLDRYSVLCDLKKGILKRVKNRDDFLENRLIRFILKDSLGNNRLELLFKNMKSGGIDLKVPLDKLNDDLDSFGSVLAEVQAANLLINKFNIQNIQFISEKKAKDKRPDFSFTYKNENEVHYAEVKSLRELSPEFWILNDKLEAESFLNTHFQKAFNISVNYENTGAKSVEELELAILDATKKLVVCLRNDLRKINILNKEYKFGNIIFKISIEKNKGKFLFVFSGNATWINDLSAFEKLSNVYSRLINNCANGLTQLKAQNSGDLKKDILVLFLNTGTINKQLFEEQLKKAIPGIVNAVGLGNIVKIVFEF